MTESTRPKRVVIVDADNPMEEIHGEFFWREDHERALAAEREAAYRDGYEHGWQAAAQRPQHVVVRYCHRSLRRLVLRAILLVMVSAFALTLIGSMTSRTHNSRSDGVIHRFANRGSEHSPDRVMVEG